MGPRSELLSFVLTGWWGRLTDAMPQVDSSGGVGQTKAKQKKKRSHNVFHHRLKRGSTAVAYRFCF